MCGRYAATADPDDLVEEFEVDDQRTASDPAPVGPDWNVAPTHRCHVVLERAPSDEPDASPVRQLRALTWGLVPSWAKDPSIGNRMINARVETLLDKPGFARAARSRRALVPADGWYEWQASPVARDARGRPRKQPFFTSLADGHRLAFAGLYEFWRDRDRPDDDPQAWRTTFTILTTDAEPGLDRIHDRMPVVVPPQRWAQWLDPGLRDPEQVRAVLDELAHQPPGRFAAHPVSRRVGDVRNNGPELVEPVPAAELEGVVDPMTGEIIGG